MHSFARLTAAIGIMFVASGCIAEAGSDEEMEGEGDVAEAEQAASAPPLTYLEVKGVVSSNYWNGGYGEQPISDGQLLTTYDHGGAEMYILTLEYGYGTTRIAQMGGANLQEAGSQAVLGAGNIVIGWYRWWNASGHQGGQFTYQSTSVNSPWNTMSDWISIR